MTNNQQLELGFNGIQRRPMGGQSTDRQTRAAWWFGQIRRTVAGAVDWQSMGRPANRPTWSGHDRRK